LLTRHLVLCLGNEVLRDDGFGCVVARRLSEEPELSNEVEVIFAARAGFALLDLLANREHVLIVDTIRTGKAPPGTLHYFPAGKMAPANHLINSHQMSLPTAMEFGKKLGASMPLQIDVLAVEAEDVETLSEELSPPVADAVNAALAQIHRWIQKQTGPTAHGENRKKTGGVAHRCTKDLP